MEIQTKPDYLIFADSAKSGEISTFPNIERGWGVTLEQTQGKPPLEWMNSAFNRIDKDRLYSLQQGVPEWDANVLYPIGAIIKVNSVIYVAKTQNSNQNPVTNVNAWELLINDATTSKKGIVKLNSATNSTSTTEAATPKAVKDAYDLADGALPKKGGTATGEIAAPTFTATNSVTIGGVAVKGLGEDLYAAGTRLMKNGDHGLGGEAIILNDFNDLSVTEICKTTSGTLNNPFSVAGNIIFIKRDSTNFTAMMFDATSEKVKYASRYSATGAWVVNEFITTANIADYSILDVEYLYPNGTADSPMTISTSQELIINSPYSGKSVTFIPQIQSPSNEGVTRWYDVPFYHENGYQWGVMIANDFPSLGSLYIRAGSHYLASNVKYSGYSEKYSPSENLNSAPFRIKVIK